LPDGLAQLGLEGRIPVIDRLGGVAQIVGLAPLMRDIRPNLLQDLDHAFLLVTHSGQEGQSQVHNWLQ
jgi:hypothetical protein